MSATTTSAVLEVSASSVVRREGYLVGTLTIEAVQDSMVAGLVLQPADELGPQWPRDFSTATDVAGVSNVALAGDSAWVFPADYVSSEPGAQFLRRSILGDRMVELLSTGDEPYAVTVIWPDTGQDTVTVDVAGTWRITDIPVES